MPRPASSAARRYLELWKDQRPPSLTGREVLGARTNPASIHRDVVLRGRRGIPRAAWAPLSVWLWARWRATGASQIDAQLSRLHPRRTEMAGLPMDEVRRRLGQLARAHGVPVRDGLMLGLFRDGWGDRWADYAYDVETSWNLVVSRRLGLTADEVDILTDKRRTARALGARGIPVVPEIVTTRPDETRDVPTAVGRWLDAAGTAAIHLKQVAGSRGDGAFEVRRVSAPGAGSGLGIEVIRYQGEEPVADPFGYIAQRLAEAPYLVQPRLATHPDLAELADPGDVVTARIVTLHPGAERRVFSCVLEVPLPATRADTGEERRYYCLLPVDEDGSIRGTLLPEWLRSDQDLPSDSPHPPESDDSWQQRSQRVEGALTGTKLPAHRELVNLALGAHEVCPRIFSVAWDVALTTDGWVLLEGNTGYGVQYPQMAAGPILVHAPMLSAAAGWVRGSPTRPTT